jgi:HK97 family phage major capsid protein
MDKKARRAQLIAEMRAMNETVLSEKRDFNEEEKKLYDEKDKEMRELSAQILAEEREAAIAGFATELPKPTNDEGRSAPQSNEMESFRKFLMTGEKRDLTVGSSGSQGNGYALAPQEFSDEIITAVEKDTQLYKIVDKIPVSGAGSLGLPYESTDASDADWTNEVPGSDISADSAWAFGKRELIPSDLAKLVKVSKKMIASSAVPIDQLVRNKLAYKFMCAFEKGILVGTGSGQPLGVFTADANGVSTARDVTSDRSAYSAASGMPCCADDLIKMKMKLRPGYRKNAVWVMHTDILKSIMLLKDNDGQYMWRPGLRDGEPDTILGMPVIESEFAPNVPHTNLYVAVLGDFKDYYKFAYWKNVDIQVLVEQFALRNCIGYLGHTLADGMPVLGEAFARLKVGNTTSTGTVPAT